jgi:hypothetical protein
MSCCLRLLCVYVVPGLAMGWSPVQGVLPTVLRLRNWSETKRFTDAVCSKVGTSERRDTAYRCHTESLKLPPTCSSFSFCRNGKEYFVLILLLSLFDSRDGWMQMHITILWARHWVIKFRNGLLTFVTLHNVLESRVYTVISVAFEFHTAYRLACILMEWETLSVET